MGTTTKKKGPSLLTYADAVGISSQRTAEWLAKIYGSRSKRPELMEFVRDYCEAIRAQASGRGDSERAKQAARKEAAQAERFERENLVETGKLVLAEDVDRMNAEVDLQIRNGFLALPSAIAGALAEMSDERQVLNFLTEEIRQVLSNLEGTEK